jgi:hypothetical protein
MGRGVVSATAALALAATALTATAAAAAEKLSLGGYFAGLEPVPEAAARAEPVILFTPRIAGFRLGEVDVGLGAAWEDGAAQRLVIGPGDAREWSAGASLGWMGFTVSGAVRSGEQDRLGASLRYDLGAWSLSLGGGQTVSEEAAGEERQLQLELGASYAFGPGVLGSLGVQTYAPDDSAYVAPGENDSVYFTGGFKLRF